MSELEVIVDRIRRNDPTLTNVDLVGQEIGDAEAEEIAAALASNTHVEVLNLYNNNIGDDGAWSIASALPQNTTLQTLCLSLNNIGIDGAMWISDALWENAALKTLEMGDNKISAPGAAYFADALQKNSSLQALCLEGNCICDRGAESLASALSENVSLQTLDLNHNNIEDVGAAFLAAALEDNATLMYLFLEENNIYEPLLQILEDSLTLNGELHTINETSSRLRGQYDMRNAEGMVGAVVDLNEENDVFEDVMFGVLQEMPEVMDRSFFGGGEVGGRKKSTSSHFLPPFVRWTIRSLAGRVTGFTSSPQCLISNRSTALFRLINRHKFEAYVALLLLHIILAPFILPMFI